jgi:DNA-binding CsgD family transcriptional regulator
MSENSQFSEREKEVTELLLQGKSNKQIALALGVSASTVEYHLKNIYKKLQVNSRTEAVLRLGKSTGSKITGELGKSTVEMKGETTDNGFQPILTRRISMNKMFAIIGGGLLTIGLVVVLLLVLVLVNTPAQSTEIAPTNISSLPDLTITSAYVSMVDNNGRCLPYYGFNVTVVNQGNARAADVTLAETNTGQEVHIGALDPLQSLSMPFVAKAASGAYTVIADPQNIIVESNEGNNSATFSEATATPVAACLPLKFGDGADTPTASPTMALIPSVTMMITDMVTPTHTAVAATLELTSLPDLIIKYMYLEMEGRLGNCVEAYTPYEIRVVVENIGLVSAGAFVVDMNSTRQEVKEGLAPGQHIELHFAGTTPSGRYEATADSMNQVVERDENNNSLSFLAPTPTPPLLCTATPTSIP